jgi:outer membrane protein W
MRTLFLTLLIAGAVAASALAQERTIVIREATQTDFFSVRAGVWFPKDAEKKFTFANAEDQSIDQSQALGLDFTYRYPMGRPLYFDFSFSGWYSTYAFKYTDILKYPSDIQQADAWVVVVPVTVGISVNPLPNGPLQPYAQAGVGLYAGICGTTEYKGMPATTTTHKENKTVVSFGGYFGAGLDFFITPAFGVSLGGKYQVIEFKEELLTKQKVFTGLQILFGVTTRL